MRIALNVAYRLYVLALPIWAATTVAWYGAGLGLASSTVASGWFGLAIYGLALAVALYTNREAAFAVEGNRHRVREFDSHVFAGTPLNLYLAALGGWGLVSAAWWAGIGQGAVSATVIGYGWYATAALGGVTLLGLCATNLDLVLEAANLSSSSASQRR